jgi:cytoskeletal protein CcmA (bactofilin family)
VHGNLDGSGARLTVRGPEPVIGLPSCTGRNSYVDNSQETDAFLMSNAIVRDFPNILHPRDRWAKVTGNKRDAIIQQDMVIRGEIRNGRRIEIHGYVEGDLAAETVVVHPTGQLYGTLRAETAEIFGMAQGKLFVRNLMSVRASGSVIGNVQYGQLALESGGNLSAELKNVPPRIGGDLQISVERGRSAAITRMDLTALDPDDSAANLTYSVTNATHGYIVLSREPTRPVAQFTQADLEAGWVYYVHDGSGTPHGSFDVVVADAAGATSGPPQTVAVEIRG